MGSKLHKTNDKTLKSPQNAVRNGLSTQDNNNEIAGETAGCCTGYPNGNLKIHNEDCDIFMRDFVLKIFHPGCDISREDKSKFGHLCQSPRGRASFAKYINAQRVHFKHVEELTLYRLTQFFAGALFECHQADDFGPAKTLMNMCFTFYHDFYTGKSEKKPIRKFLHIYLKDQPIWQCSRFWQAAFFEALKSEPLATNVWNNMSSEEKEDHDLCGKNSTFGQLMTFTNNMQAFGLSQETCLNFTEKMGIIGGLGEDQVKLLKEFLKKESDDELPVKNTAK